MSKGLERKINSLEKHVLNEPEPGTTQFCHWALPEPEQALIDKAISIAHSGLAFDETTEEHRRIMVEADRLIRFRIFDLFTFYLENLLCRDDKIAKVTVHERFLWFILELMEEVRQNLEASEIEKTAPATSEVDLVDEYFRKQRDVFTEESYDKLTSDLTLEWMKTEEGKKALEKLGVKP